MSSWDFVGLMDNTTHALTILLLKLRMARKVSQISLMPSRSTRSVPSAGQYSSTHSIQNLPRIAILVMPTCNTFDDHFVYQQWQEVKRFYDQEFKNIMGPPIGNSSDGNSRRWKIMLQLATVDVGNRFRPIPRNIRFIFSCRKLDTDENGYHV